jgi:hypothetical protein
MSNTTNEDLTRNTDPHDNTDPHRVEVTEHGHRLAAAEVTGSPEAHGTARVSFHAESGHLPTGTRRNLVDAVLDSDEVHDSDHLQASVPIGDVESIDRLRERTSDLRIHAAGCTALIEAELTGTCEGSESTPS